VSNNLLELLLINGKYFFELLDLIQEILWHVGHRTCCVLVSFLPAQYHFARGVRYVPLREGLRRGPIPTMMTAGKDYAVKAVLKMEEETAELERGYCSASGMQR
jgi:hypothetical protein